MGVLKVVSGERDVGAVVLILMTFQLKRTGNRLCVCYTDMDFRGPSCPLGQRKGDQWGPWTSAGSSSACVLYNHREGGSSVGSS